ncbi:hypothetical protein [Lysobacter gummosus]|uniref:hypothetical protein n=1 Tax=Lysobacter gummosus TaxID=262324 RepID=UPI003632C43F
MILSARTQIAMAVCVRASNSSFPRTRALLYFGGAEHPVPFVREPLKSLDSRFRGNDDLVEWR